MKKLLFTLLLFLTGIAVIRAKETTDSFESRFIGTYHYVDNDTGGFGDFEIFRRKSDGTIAFCIEPNVSLSQDKYQGYYDLSNKELASKVGLTEELLEKISLVSYFGHQNNINNTEWIVALQTKIWQLLGRNISFTSRNSQANPWQYVIPIPGEIQDKLNKIDRFLNEYYADVPLKAQNFSLALGEKFVYEAEGLAHYQMKEVNNDVQQNGNKLVIQPSIIGNFTMTLAKEYPSLSQPFVVYHSTVGQDLSVSGRVPSKTTKFTYSVQAGAVKVIKKDKDTNSSKPSGDASLEGIVVGLFKSDGTKLKEITLQNCEGEFANLSLGDYYIQELKASKGYILDDTKYKFSITKDNIGKTQIIQIYNQVKKTKVNIHKRYLAENIVETDEQGAEFQIISKKTGKVLETLKTDQFGKASIVLPYGEYYLKQIKGKDGFYFVSNQDISIREDTKDNINISLLNRPILKEVQIRKKDLESKEAIKMDGIMFRLYDVTHQKYFCQNKGCVFTTNQDGEIVIKGLYYATYRLEEVQQKVNGYLWNQNTLHFEVNEKSPQMILLDFFNQPVKGKVEIHKTNEHNEPLEGIGFQLYAKEDIYANHTLIYKKDDLVTTIYTNQEGNAISDTIPLGEYYLKEITVLDEYLPNQEIYDVSLLDGNEFTEIVIESFDIINFKIPETGKNDYSKIMQWSIIGLGLLFYEKKKYCSI